MITLKGSRFIVEQDENSNSDLDYKVFIRNKDGLQDISTTLTNDEKDELISDLIYCLGDLLKSNAKT